VAPDVASRLWSRDPALFIRTPTGDLTVHEAIRHRLGWLDAPARMAALARAASDFASDVRAAGLSHVYLLGMGGSSLCAEVLRDTAAGPGAARLDVLDTTDERAIRAATDQLDPSRALFLVASKSGSTIEVASQERHFWAVMHGAFGDGAGRHFAAITDPDTRLSTLAAERRYRACFVNAPDIGGRYSALSLFGLVPAALLGVDLDRLAASATGMADACRSDDAGNPGVLLGRFLAANALAGRDKLTVLLPPGLEPLGVWIEQLVAESTGKAGKGVLPIVDETPGAVAEYRADRAFVVTLTDEAASEPLARLADALEAAGHSVFRIRAAAGALGAEFFRWEFATAVASHGLGVNAFDEPNVRDAKVRTEGQLAWRAEHGTFRVDPPFERRDGYLRREYRPGLRARTGSLPGRYLAILDYLPGDPRRGLIVQRLRAALRARAGTVSTYGVGPRYLHSTGQYHKGGPNTGLFVLLTAADPSATPIPDTTYSFSTLKQAQAFGDFDALAAAGCDIVHYHVEDPTADFSEALERIVAALG
jgi:hypothetical protein